MSGVLTGRFYRTAAVAAVAALISTVALGPLSSAGASKLHAKAVVASGSVSCSAVTGSVTFDPAEHHIGTAPVRITIVFRASHCTTRGSNVKHILSGSLGETVTKPTNACASSLTIFSHSVQATGTWTAKGVRLAHTSGRFSGFAFVFAANGDVGVVIPNVGGAARITGSFAGANHGATSTAVGYINLTAQQVRAACKSPGGLTSLVITHGRATFS